jgi:mRNA interferase MazF
VKWAAAPGNILLASRLTGLEKDSVALVAQVITLDKSALTERCGKLSAAKLASILSGLDLVLDR